MIETLNTLLVIRKDNGEKQLIKADRFNPDLHEHIDGEKIEKLEREVPDPVIPTVDPDAPMEEIFIPGFNVPPVPKKRGRPSRKVVANTDE